MTYIVCCVINYFLHFSQICQTLLRHGGAVVGPAGFLWNTDDAEGPKQTGEKPAVQGAGGKPREELLLRPVEDMKEDRQVDRR